MIRIDALYLLLLGEAFLLMTVMAVFLYVRLRKVRAMKQRTRVQEVKTEVVTASPEQQQEIDRLKTELARLEGIVTEREAEINKLQSSRDEPERSATAAADAATALQDELLSINIDMPREEDLSAKVRELEALVAAKDKELAAAQGRFDSLELEYLALYNEKNAQP
ncbi:MAG: hypothetical protein C0402_11845 [Thermodesulfovibrio sp.]|nr:hypothetical protein [Thermodesulfovibrio sp.]